MRICDQQATVEHEDHVCVPDVMVQDDPVPANSCDTCGQVRNQADMLIPNDRNSQNFQSSDAVKSHQKKHSLSLRLTAAGTSLTVPPVHGFPSPPVMPSLREEMPTPRRFLKEFERNSSFLDDIVGDGSKRCIPSATESPISGCIAENPFAETFRRASFSKEPVPVSHELKVPDESESLNTPSIQLNASQENPLSHPLSQRCISVEAESVIRSPLPHLHHKHPLISEPSVTKPTTRSTAQSPHSHIDFNLLQANQSDATKKKKSDDSSSRLSPETSVTGAASDSLTHEINPNIRLIPPAMPVLCSLKTTVSRGKVSKKKGVFVRKVALILPKLEPAVSSCPPLSSNGVTASSTVIPAATPSVPTITICSPASPLSSITPSGNNVNGVSPLTTQSDYASPVRMKPGRKKKGQEVEDEEEKRLQNLDRNRESAQRSRMKRKRTIQEVEERADRLTHENNRLQMEVESLRSEVLSLKAALMAHRECPVTLQRLRLTVQQHNTAQPSC